MRHLAPILTALACALGVLFVLQAPIRQQVEDEGKKLMDLAWETANKIDGAAHARIKTAEDPEFLAIRTQLRLAHSHGRLRSPLYTLKQVGTKTEFVVMTNPSPYLGHEYILKEEMRKSFDRGLPAQTVIYGDDHGRWISGYAAIRDGDTIVGIVEADRPAGDLHEQLLQAQLMAALAGVVGLLLALLGRAALGSDLSLIVMMRRGVRGSLAVRMGIAGTIPVIVAVGIVSWLQYRQTIHDQLESTRSRLQNIVSLAVPRIDPDLHARVTERARTDTDDFAALVAELRAIRSEAGLDTDVYTLRRDGEQTRFVAMTNETPYLGDPYELRDGPRMTFDSGGTGVEGPYGDEHGQWISAWAPIPDGAGGVAAIFQADEEVTTVMAAARNRALRDLVFALLGTLAAFLVGAAVAESLARPIRRIAGATQKIQDGDYRIDVPHERLDEVGSLARSVQGMARSLQEKERLRDMFGKYMAREVVKDLLDKDELALDGELREVTVLLTDIRGYTALTEQLGAAEVVALLNEYFSILINAVIEEGGVIDKFMGDALLAWFGAPVPQADHRERAVRTAIRVLERSAEWNADRVARGLQPVATGIGLAAGEVVVGNIGSDVRLEYTAIGDAVNLSSRLCGKAEAGEILATSDVAAVEGEFVTVGEIEVKGVKDPVPVHRLTRPITATG